jgi:hypothetical protein
MLENRQCQSAPSWRRAVYRHELRAHLVGGLGRRATVPQADANGAGRLIAESGLLRPVPG